MTRLRSLGAVAAVAATGALAALAPAAGANVQVGSSGWEWGNPLPQGNQINELSFAGLKGYAVGSFGTLLTTEDGGASWNGLPSGTFQTLNEVQAVDAATVVAGGGCVARRSDDGGRTFSRIAFTPVEASCREELSALAFASKTTGFVILTDGTVLQTTDGGTEFAQKTAIPGTRSATGGGQGVPTDATFVTDTIGFVTSTDGKILRTTDAGNTWTPVADFARAVNGIVFADATTAYAVGRDSLFVKSTDGGATWAAKDIGAAGQQLRQIRCASPVLCVAGTEKGDVIVRTADGGTTFSLPAPSTSPIFGVGFASPTRLVAAGASGATVLSDDAGVTFTPIGGAVPGQFTRMRAGGAPGSAFAPGKDGALAKTLDGGKTWTRSNVSTSEDLLDVSFPTTNDGFALDVQGGLFRTTSGGAAWSALDPGTTAIPQAVFAPSKDTVLLIGPTGVRRQSGGGEFSAVRGKAVARTPLGHVDSAGTHVVAYGSQQIIRSSDQGRTWKAVRKPGRYDRRGRNRYELHRVDFVSANTGFVLGDDGKVWRTRNGGRSWTELPGVATDDAYGMAFSSATSGYLIIDRFGANDEAGYLLRTKDGGSTWHPQFVVADRISDLGIAAPGGGTDYLLGGVGSLLFSQKGGDAGAASTLTATTTRRRLSKPQRIQVRGRLTPASGSEQVVVARRKVGSSDWETQTVKVAANGSYTTSWNLRRGRYQFVAQWQGSFRSAGDGSSTLEVRVGRR